MKLVNMATFVIVSTIFVGFLLVCPLHTEAIPPLNLDQGLGHESSHPSSALPVAPRKLRVDGAGAIDKVTSNYHELDKDDKKEEGSRMSSEFMGMDYYHAQRRRPVHNQYPRPAAP